MTRLFYHIQIHLKCNEDNMLPNYVFRIGVVKFGDLNEAIELYMSKTAKRTPNEYTITSVEFLHWVTSK